MFIKKCVKIQPSASERLVVVVVAVLVTVVVVKVVVVVRVLVEVVVVVVVTGFPFSSHSMICTSLQPHKLDPSLFACSKITFPVRCNRSIQSVFIRIQSYSSCFVLHPYVLYHWMGYVVVLKLGVVSEF